MKLRWRSIALIVVLGLTAVASLRIYRGPISTLDAMGRCLSGGIDLNNPVPFSRPRYGETIVGVAASGGGSRAAYLAAAVLHEIRRGGPDLVLGKSTGSQRSLLDQVDIMSSVSGGSLAASFFVLNSEILKHAKAKSEPWNEYLNKMAIEYRKQQWFRQAILNPTIWAKSLFTDYNRGVLARDDYNALLFKDATLDQLPDRPALYINAFDVANHVRFVLSKHYINTTYFQPRDWWGKLAAPQTLMSANDLSFARIDPGSIRVADAVYASSSFPIAYPNLPLRHCGSKILYQGGLIFLADGALADNSGLLSLFTQLRANLGDRKNGVKRASIVAIAIDATVDRIDTNGTKFQQMGVEDRYAWENTVVGHAQESIFGAIALLQDLGWTFIQSTGVITDQLNMNWPIDLTRRTGNCGSNAKASWDGMFESGKLAMRPLIIRLGLRDVINPNFVSTYGRSLQNRPELAALLRANGVLDGIAALPKHLGPRLQRIPTDFTLSAGDRRLLDLTAFLLVHGKLAGDVERWNEISRTVGAAPFPSISCPH